MMNASPPPSPVVCIPHAGAGASVFRRWATLAAGRLVPLSLPGREARHREPCLDSIEAMARDVLDGLARADLRGATLYGHSLGALVAYEAARQEAGGGRVRRLVVSGCRGPASPPSLRLSAIADDDAFLDAVGELGGLPAGEERDPAVTAYALPILRADLGAADAYRPVRPEKLSVPVLALGGDDDPFVPPSALAAWQEIAGTDFEQVVMPGDHFFVFGPHGDRVLQRLLHS